MNRDTESAVVAALSHGAASGFDGLHDSAFDASCAAEGALPQIDYSAGRSEPDGVGAAWRFLAGAGVALLAAVLLAHWAACESGGCL